MKKTIAGAAVGVAIGFLLAIVFFWAGPYVVEWIKGPPRLETEAWVFYVVAICGAGFGAVAGAIIGASAAITNALRTRGRTNV